jgi:hypothetical protein
MQLLMSLTEDLPTVHFAAEIVGWDDKRSLPEQKRNVLSWLIRTLQPNEGGLYDASRAENSEGVNLLHVRRLRRLDRPFSVVNLVNAGDGRPVSDRRATSGRWIYVRTDNPAAVLR